MCSGQSLTVEHQLQDFYIFYIHYLFGSGTAPIRRVLKRELHFEITYTKLFTNNALIKIR